MVNLLPSIKMACWSSEREGVKGQSDVCRGNRLIGFGGGMMCMIAVA